jgi:hypothetical protein
MGETMKYVVFIIVLACGMAAVTGCETRVIKKEEKIFMEYADKYWDKLTPRQKADYYRMKKEQKERARAGSKRKK